MALTFIGRSVMSAIIENLVNTCSSYLMAYPAASGMQDELERLQYAPLQVQTVLNAVEEDAPAMMQNEGLHMWLWQLRDAVENAEDMLDELAYYKLEKTIQDRDDKVIGLFSKFKEMFGRFFNHKFSDDTLKRLREVVKELDRVVVGIGSFLQIADRLHGPSVKRRKLEEVKNARETSCLLTESEVLGREKERNQIVEWLIKPVDDESEGIPFNVSVFTIVGMGGLGKTTLAQLIYHDERVREYFDRIMWVCVSQDFDAAAITRKMLEEINHKSSDHMHSLNALHKDLKKKLKSKRFLLILDDVWNDDKKREWENLVAPLKFGQRGSKILLTTRMGSVADMAARVMEYKRESLDLKELEGSDCMSLFNKHAFLGVNPDDRKNLQPIGEQIVKKLGGCPLAIKVMGGLLNSCEDYEYWKRILKEDTMIVQQRENDIRKVLKLSYDHLPTNLQVCFRYCSIFPQDYTFKRKSLVYMWMGSGLIPQSTCRRRSQEDIGREYLDILIRKSLFTCKTIDNRLKTSKRYFMHDLLHDLAQSVSLGECIRIRDDIAGKIILDTVRSSIRHLSIEMVNLLSIREISHLKNLRTLIISINNDDYNVDHLLVFNEVMEGFKKLRLLSLDVHSNYYKLPTAVSSLIHLRYLSLSQRAITNKSFIDFSRSSPCRLYHLQFLKLLTLGITPCNIENDGLTNLLNLRLLDDRHGMIKNIRYVSKLPFIHKLENFLVQEESGYKIGELKNLRYLRHLCIGQLENVRSSEEAMEAELNKKEYLKSLSLQWSKDRSNSAEADEQLLDNLCPHINLKRLSIQNYKGVKSPCWITDPSLINLTSIELIDCKGWEHLPPLGGLPLLSRLYLCELHEVKQIGRSFYGSSGVCAFPSLKDLIFDGLPNLEEWIGIDDGCMFPQLHSIEITGCPNLGGIPTLRCSLKRMKISYVGFTALPTINLDCGNNNQQGHCKILESLIIKQCEKLQDVPPEYFLKFNSLKFLCIEKCPKLTTRGISDIQLPSTLNELTIGSCGDLEVPLLWSANLASLAELNLIDCARITSFPPEQVCAWRTTLSRLTITDCKELSSFGGLQDLECLRSLEITGCDKLIEVAMSANDVSQENAKDCCLKLGELSIDHHALLLMKPLRSLTSISSLTLSDASQLTSLPEEWILQNRTALKCLSISNANSLQSLPQSMTTLCFLQDLRVYNAKLIQSLPDLPTSLQTLYITRCHPVLKERCQKNIGLDWPKIAEIPDVMIE